MPTRRQQMNKKLPVKKNQNLLVESSESNTAATKARQEADRVYHARFKARVGAFRAEYKSATSNAARESVLHRGRKYVNQVKSLEQSRK